MFIIMRYSYFCVTCKEVFTSPPDVCMCVCMYVCKGCVCIKSLIDLLVFAITLSFKGLFQWNLYWRSTGPRCIRTTLVSTCSFSTNVMFCFLYLDFIYRGQYRVPRMCSYNKSSYHKVISLRRRLLFLKCECNVNCWK